MSMHELDKELQLGDNYDVDRFTQWYEEGMNITRVIEVTAGTEAGISVASDLAEKSKGVFITIANYTINLIALTIQVGFKLFRLAKWIVKELDYLHDYVVKYKKRTENWARRMNKNIDDSKIAEAHLSVLDMEKLKAEIVYCGKMVVLLKNGFITRCVEAPTSDPFLKQFDLYKKYLQAGKDSPYQDIVETKTFDKLEFQGAEWKSDSSKRRSLKEKGYGKDKIRELLGMSIELSKLIDDQSLRNEVTRLDPNRIVNALKSAVQKIKSKDDPKPEKETIQAIRAAHVQSEVRFMITHMKRVYAQLAMLFEHISRNCVVDDNVHTDTGSSPSSTDTSTSTKNNDDDGWDF